MLDNTVRRYNNIADFVDEVKLGTKTLPLKNDNAREKQLLTKVMTHLRDVSQIKDKTLALVNPMRD